METASQKQLILAVEATSAIWAAQFQIDAGTFGLESHVNLSDSMAARLETFVGRKPGADWIRGCLSTESMRFMEVDREESGLSCKIISCFPGRDSFTLVGTDNELEGVSKKLFELLSADGPVSGDGQSAAEGIPQGSAKKTLKRIESEAGPVISEVGLEAVISQSSRQAKELAHADGVQFGLLDQHKREVRVLYNEREGELYPKYSAALEDSFLGQVIHGRKPLVASDKNGHKQVLEKQGYASAAGVPLSIRGQVIGALAVFSGPQAEPFTEEELLMLEILAPQVSISIRSAGMLKELNDRLQNQREEEKKIAETARMAALGEMAATVAHELNNPLTTIAGFTELVIEDLGEEFPQRRDLQLILKEARRAREVVRRLLDFSRPGEHPFQRISINDTVSEVLAVVQSTALSQNIELRFEAWETLPPVMGDLNQLKQVFINLVSNAFYAMPKGGMLLIQTLKEQKNGMEFVVIRVKDEGLGIAAKHLPLIFKPFFTTKPIGSGTGLGLSISRSIIAELEGEIKVESKEGQGTTFIVRLPAASPEESPE